MPCYSFLDAWRGPMASSGKRPLVFSPRESTSGANSYLKVPCGQCIGCRIDYTADWAVRCVCEAEMHVENSFITLTYSDDKLPKNNWLDVRDWQLFMKKVRKFYGNEKRIRYFHAGEYSELGRPHYHGLLFGLDFADKRYFKTTPAGSKIYVSDELSHLWGKGYSSVGEVNFDSAQYLAKYCLKKTEVLNERYEDENGKKFDVVLGSGEIRTPEYVTMSRGVNGRGIGYSWFEKYWSDVYPHDYVELKDGRKLPPPRYFDDLYGEKNCLDMKRIKLHRMSRNVEMNSVWNDRLKVCEDVYEDDTRRLLAKESFEKAKAKLFARKFESGQ